MRIFIGITQELEKAKEYIEQRYGSRITSYNVCYTKLLRTTARPKSLFAWVKISLAIRLWSSWNPCLIFSSLAPQDVITSYSIHYTKLYEAVEQYCFNIQWQYALDITNGSDAYSYVSLKSLFGQCVSFFRKRDCNRSCLILYAKRNNFV